MSAPRTNASPSDVAAEVGSWSAGLGILTTVLFPFALPGLVLLLPVVLLPLAGLLVAAPVVLPILLVRRIRRGRSGRAPAGVPARPRSSRGGRLGGSQPAGQH